MAKRFSWVLFSAFSNLWDYLQKGTSGFLFSTSFSNSLNMKKMSIFTFVGLVKISNSDGLVVDNEIEPFLL